MSSPEFEQLLKSQVSINKKIQALHEDLVKVVEEINRTCQHEDLVADSSYSYGSYSTQGEDRSWDKCLHCGKTFNLKIRYTGFG